MLGYLCYILLELQCSEKYIYIYFFFHKGYFPSWWEVSCSENHASGLFKTWSSGMCYLTSFYMYTCEVYSTLYLAIENTCSQTQYRKAVVYLALINQAGGLYGRILTEVMSTDQTQWGLYTQLRSRFSHTDQLSLVNKMFIIWQAREI